MRSQVSKILVALAAGSLAASIVVAAPTAATAYQPAQSTLYTATAPDSCNKNPCILYPKSVQLPSGRLLAAFEDSQGPVVGQDMPIFKSDDNGDTWQPLTSIVSPDAASTDPAYDGLTSNWTNPYFYVLPEALGPYAKGTAILATVTSSGADGNNDRFYSAIVLWASTDDGATWAPIAKPVASPTSYTGTSGDTVWQDPTWEPYLMMHEGKLVVYYSDERDVLGYDAATGVVQFNPGDASDPDFVNQILAHTAWDGSGSWSAPVMDVAGLTDTRYGRTELGGGRPGMTTIVPTTDGRWLLTYEYWAGGDNVRYKIADDPTKFFAAAGGPEGFGISQLPVAAGSGKLAQGGSPVLTVRPDGALLYNAAGSGSVWINESGRSDGVWKEYQTSVPGGYSRNLQYVDATGRVLIVQAPWGGSAGKGPVSYATVDFGNSEGAYYSIVNRATSQYVSTVQDKTQDMNKTGDQPDIITWSNNPANPTQRWHVQPKGSSVSFLNKSGGRSLAIFQGDASAGRPLVQWVDDNGGDKFWNLIPTDNGFVKIQSAKNTAMYVTSTGAGGQVQLAPLITPTGNMANDDPQEWQLAQEAPTTASLGPARQSGDLVGDSVEAGALAELNASTPDPASAKTAANITGHVYAITGADAAVDLGTVTFDGDEKATVAIPETFAPSTDVKLIVQFDGVRTIWDSLAITPPSPVTVTPTVTGPAGSNGWFRGAASISFATTGPGVGVQYRMNGAGEWTTATGPITVSAEGVTSVNYRAVKNGVEVAGSESAAPVRIDTVAPVTAPVVTPTSGVAAVGATITATFDATDATSGVAVTEYSLDGGQNWTAATAAGVSFTQRGTYVVQYRSVDTAGNAEAAKSVTLTVTDPQSTPKVTITSADAPNADGWYQQSVVVALKSPDASQKVQYRTNNGAWRTYSSALTVGSNGITTIDYRLLKSNVVVTGSEAQTVIKLDKTAPTTTASRSPATSAGTPRNPINITFAAADATSGVGKIEYRVNNGSWTVASGNPLTLAVVGDYVVSYRATDLAGNVSAVRSTTATIKPDTTPAIKVSSSSAKPGDAVTVNLSGFVRWDDVTLKFGSVVLTTAFADVNGSARITVRIPADATRGVSTLTAVSSEGSLTATVKMTVK